MYFLFVVRELGLNAALLGIIISIGGACGLFGAFMAEWLVHRFGFGPTFIGSALVIGVAMLIGIPGQMWFTAVESTGDTAAALGIDFFLTLVMLGMTYFGAIHLGWPIAWIWLTVPITWLLCLGISYGWIKSGIWKRLDV